MGQHYSLFSFLNVVTLNAASYEAKRSYILCFGLVFIFRDVYQSLIMISTKTYGEIVKLPACTVSHSQ